jgi:hypothetical protein
MDLAGKSANQLEKEYGKLFNENKEEVQKHEELLVFKNERLKEYIGREQEYREIIEKLNKKLRPKELYTGDNNRINL